MPSTTPCVHCGLIGNVRWERVITGTVGFVEYYCGRCEHMWRVDEDGERRGRTPDRRGNSRTDRRRVKE